MGNGITALLFGIGFGGWAYFMMMRQSGGIVKTSATVAGIAGAAGFFVIYTLLATFFSN